MHRSPNISYIAEICDLHYVVCGEQQVGSFGRTLGDVVSLSTSEVVQ